jgi:DNA helicase-2/ATP-dependent DNA helicase PcrA
MPKKVATTKKTAAKAKPEKRKKILIQQESILPNDPLLEGLNDPQRIAVTYGAGPLLIVAGAGTGKTSVITKRIAHLIASGVKAEEILALTFTEKAATEMEERIDRELPFGYYDLWVSTFHGFCERILKQHALDIGLPNDFKTLDTTQQKIIIRQNLEQFNLDYYRPLGNPTKFISAMADHFSSTKDEEVSAADYVNFADALKPIENPDNSPDILGHDQQDVQRIKEIAHAYKTYQDILLKAGALDFGDLISCTLHLFRTRPRILNFYRNRFKYILVDEFQDTNYAQYELVKLLAAPRNNLTVVGDDDQSIYKFRGASVTNILSFRDDYPSAQEITLTENYRSVQGILDASYNVIQLNNPDRLESILNISKKMSANVKSDIRAITPENSAVSVLTGQTIGDEVDAVINKILQIRKSEHAEWNDFAILVRANNHAEPFTAKLGALGLPYMQYSNRGLYRKPIIVDIIQYIRVLLNYHDSTALYRVLSMDPFKMDYADLMLISHYANKRTVSLYEALAAAPTIAGMKASGLGVAQEVIRLLSLHGPLIREKTAGESFVTIIKDLGIAGRVEPETVENAASREFIEQFYRKIEAFESDAADKSMRNFIELLDFEQEAGEEGKLKFDPQSGPESINVLTIHASKGLEFKYVFVVNMISRRFPSTERADLIELPVELIRENLPGGEAHLQEERRLLYVAMTRAKRQLFFSYAADYGGARTVKPSQFLVELGLVAKPEKTVTIDRQAVGAARQKIYRAADHLPETFSFTQLSDFKSCPMRFKYRHWLKLPLPGSAYLSFGSTIHKTLELFLTAYKADYDSRQGDLFKKTVVAPAATGKNKKDKIIIPPLEDLLGLYERSWVDEWYDSKLQKQQYKENGLQIIKSFYDNFSSNPVVPKYIEKSFRLPLDKYFFVGKIDRADPGEKGLNIVDYKTGKSKKDLDADGKDQLLIYQWAAQEYMKETISGLCYWYLMDNEFSETFLGSAEELKALKAKLLETIEEIRSAIANDSFKELDKKAPRHNCEFEDLD